MAAAEGASPSSSSTEGATLNIGRSWIWVDEFARKHEGSADLQPTGVLGLHIFKTGRGMTDNDGMIQHLLIWSDLNRDSHCLSLQESKKCRRDFAAPWQRVYAWDLQWKAHAVSIASRWCWTCLDIFCRHENLEVAWTVFKISQFFPTAARNSWCFMQVTPSWGDVLDISYQPCHCDHANSVSRRCFQTFPQSIQHRGRRLDCSFRQMELSIIRLLFSKVCFLGFGQKYRRSWQCNVAQRKTFEYRSRKVLKWMMWKPTSEPTENAKLFLDNLDKAKGLVYIF